MRLGTTLIRPLRVSGCVTLLAAGMLQAQTAATPAIDEGLADANEPVSLTVHMALPDEAGFDKAVQALYDPASPQYGHWMSDADLQRWAPSKQAVAQVTAQLQKYGLTVSAEDPQGFSLHVQGSTGAAQQAFQISMHRFAASGRSFVQNVGQPKLSGGADVLVRSVSGLRKRTFQPMLKRATDPRTGKALAMPFKPAAGAGFLGTNFTDKCFTDPQTFVYQTAGQNVPTGAYFGNVYDDTTKVCAFTAGQLQGHYGLLEAYKQGYDGAGETIAITDAYGYPDVLNDANLFSQLNGLPQFEPGQLRIAYPNGKPADPDAGVKTGWDGEIALDVQWVHAIAPKANIVLVIAVDNSDASFESALNYVLSHHSAHIVSNSWGDSIPDSQVDPAYVKPFNDIFRRAAARGIAVNYSSGDDGDYGINTPIGAASDPADSPYVTAVGGTSILTSINGGTQETGWGNYRTRIADGGVLAPPVQRGFAFGAGGGESALFAKPSWQAGLPGTGRQVPDVAALADPYTGVNVVLTENGETTVGSIGGTSLACPIFSAIWALADQAAGHPLGLAAPRIARMTSQQVEDVVPLGSATNASGIIFDSNRRTVYAPRDLFSEAPTLPVNLVSAIWPIDSATAQVVSFETDTSLTVALGWDNVTGFGVPNGLAFIEGAAGKE